MKFHEEAFEAAARITAAVAEEAEIELDAEGAEKAAEFFSVLYKKLAAVARGEEVKGEEKPEKKRVEVREHRPEEDEQPSEENGSEEWYKTE